MIGAVSRPYKSIHWLRGGDEARRKFRWGEHQADALGLANGPSTKSGPAHCWNATRFGATNQREGCASDPMPLAASPCESPSASALGFTKENASALEGQLFAGLKVTAATERKSTEFGRTYTVDIPVSGPVGGGIVRTGWHIDTGTDIPRLVSAYVVRG